MAIAKAYLKRVVTHLNENDKADQVDAFKKGATDFIKLIVGKFDEV
jgi:PleD family two-component response regulator